MFVSDLHSKYLPPNFRFYTKNEQNLQRGEWEAGHLMLGSHHLNGHAHGTYNNLRLVYIEEETLFLSIGFILIKK